MARSQSSRCLRCGQRVEFSPSRPRKFCSLDCNYEYKRAPERFWERIDRRGTCWLWTAGKVGAGYGATWSGAAHRVAWELTYGPIPRGLFVCHRCDIRACVRPDHLWLGTQHDNMRDASGKDRMKAPRGETQHAAVLTAAIVKKIRRAQPQGQIRIAWARRYGVSPGHIWRVMRGLEWRHV
jgi:hypothetical protein